MFPVSPIIFFVFLSPGNVRRLSASLPPGALPIVGALGVTHDGGASRRRFEAFGDAAWRHMAGTAEGHALVYEGMLAYQLGDKAGSSSSSASSSGGGGGGSSSSSLRNSGTDGSGLTQGSSNFHAISSGAGSGNVQVRATLRLFLEEVYATTSQVNARSAMTASGNASHRGYDDEDNATAVAAAFAAEDALPLGSAVLDLSRCFADPRPPPPCVDTAAAASSRPNVMDPVAALGWWAHTGSSSSSSSGGIGMSSSSAMVSGGSSLVSSSVGGSSSSSSGSSGAAARAYPPSVWPAIAPSSAEAGALAAMLLHAAEFGAVVSDGVGLDVNGFAGLWASAAISEGERSVNVLAHPFFNHHSIYALKALLCIFVFSFDFFLILHYGLRTYVRLHGAC